MKKWSIVFKSTLYDITKVSLIKLDRIGTCAPRDYFATASKPRPMQLTPSGVRRPLTVKDGLAEQLRVSLTLATLTTYANKIGY